MLCDAGKDHALEQALQNANGAKQRTERGTVPAGGERPTWDLRKQMTLATNLARALKYQLLTLYHQVERFYRH